MASFKAVVRKARVDGIYPVYIRVTHNRKTGYIKTPKLIAPERIKKDGDFKDTLVNEYCSRLIREFTDKVNRRDISELTLPEVIEYLSSPEDADVCFSEYAALHIDRMRKRGQARNAKNYELAKKHLERYMCTTRVMFSHLTSALLTRWIATLGNTNRAKEMYPVCIRQIFKAALVELNDEERGICRIKFNPWMKVQIPKADKAAQRAISAEACREFFNRPLPKSKMISSLPELGRDVAMLVLCLGGINTVDLFEMKKSNYHNGVIGYNRAKTKHARADEAYIEMRVEPFIRPVFEKYLADESSEYLFNFHNRYSNSDSFCANVNNGIKKICKDMGMEREDWYCVYTFRHTWGTIAQNDCDANLYEVAFGMNHSHGLKVTRGFGNVNAVVKALAEKLPKDMPEGCAVQFRIQNIDKGTEVVYEHTKGKGF